MERKIEKKKTMIEWRFYTLEYSMLKIYCIICLFVVVVCIIIYCTTNQKNTSYSPNANLSCCCCIFLFHEIKGILSAIFSYYSKYFLISSIVMNGDRPVGILLFCMFILFIICNFSICHLKR